MSVIYMDHASTTPISRNVLRAMLPYLSEQYGNPSSPHSLGRKANAAIETARVRTATGIGAMPGEIYFTSGGTESDNWAIKGAAISAFRQCGKRHIITSSIEHHAILHACEYLEKLGFYVTYLPVDGDGLVSPSDLEKSIRQDTSLISIMAANNEIGTIEPIREIGRIARDRGILFHTDAVQAIGNLPVHVKEWNVDLLSLSAHKFYGPKGVGALYVRHGAIPDALMHGGAQEGGRRSGTENVPGIVGLGLAIEYATQHIEELAEKTIALRDCLISGILDRVPESRLNGHPTRRLAGNVNISFPGVDAQLLLLQLEARGILASAGAACSSGQAQASHVLKALNLPWAYVSGGIRFSLGYHNTMTEVEYTISAISEAVKATKNLQMNR